MPMIIKFISLEVQWFIEKNFDFLLHLNFPDLSWCNENPIGCVEIGR